MSNQILVQYDMVYNKTAQLRSRIEAELLTMNTAYNQACSSLQEMDGGTNAALSEAIEENRRKAQVTADILRNLLSFIELSARQVEQDEKILKSMFDIKSGNSGGGVN